MAKNHPPARAVFGLACLIVGAPLIASADPSVDAYDLYAAAGNTVAPAVILLQGARVDKEQYAAYARHIATAGFHVVVPNHVRKVDWYPQPSFYTIEEVAADTFNTIKSENENSGSPLYHRVDLGRFATVGHSFGGVVGLLAADGGSCAPPLCLSSFTRPKELKAVLVLATTTFYNNQFMPINNSGVAIGLIAGELDSLSPQAAVLGSYERMLSPRAYFAVKGVNHYGMTKDNPPADAKLDPERQTVPQDQGIATLAEYSSQFLRAFLLEDQRERDTLRSLADKGSSERLSAVKVDLGD
jgi:dienelactone hydrolase